jgi:hypothetical protein
MSSKGLTLYRQLMRYGHNLKYTDKSFYFAKIRKEFEKSKNLSTEEEVDFVILKGKTFLKNGRLL